MNKSILFFILSLAMLTLSPGAGAQTRLIPGPAGSVLFGQSVTVLSNGNYVITDPYWTNGTLTQLGAVYLYNGATHALISTLTGTLAGDRVGGNGVTALNNGNYVVCSPDWNGKTGAVTLCSGTSGIAGAVSASNSLVGSTANDSVGAGGIAVLPNGNYVVRSPLWNNGVALKAGAVTLGSGTTGISGAVTASNSLVGSTTGDSVGNRGVTVLSTSNYIVNSPRWDNGTITDAGAATRSAGTSGITGTISSSNSLVGSSASDLVSDGGTKALTSGRYVVISPSWKAGTFSRAGAVTWSGSTGISGAVTSTNSLVGTGTDAQVGSGGVTLLSNGNYVVCSPSANNGSFFLAGAATWANGSTGITGSVSSSNSLIGGTVYDQVGYSGITALTNGNYVVSSGHFTNGTISTWYGAATWGNGTTGITGTITSSNSLIGNANDQLGVGGTTALSNGNYVVCSPGWDNGSMVNVGAVTWGNGTTGITGSVTTTNSLVGGAADQLIGSAGATALTNGNYVVCSPFWNSGVLTNLGAATWCSGAAATTGTVSATNSLVGTQTGDQIGGGKAYALTNGNYVVASNSWANGTQSNAGAITWGNGSSGTTGAVSSSNSYVGSRTYDLVGYGGLVPLSNGDFYADNIFWQVSSGIGGAVTYGSGTGPGNTGALTNCNSVRSSVYSGLMKPAYNDTYNYLLVTSARANNYSIFIPGGHGQADSGDVSTKTLSGTAPVILGSSDCRTIAVVRPSGAAPVSGAVTAKAYVRSGTPTFNGQAYVRRHYDITPAANASTATAIVTLYFTDLDFYYYNLNSGGAQTVPYTPTDRIGIANLRITQEHGTSTSGLPGTYTGWAGTGPKKVVIDPNDNDIVWNEGENRWEVSFPVTGFSGFFVHGNTATPLPLELLRFDAQKADAARNRVDWAAAKELDGTVFDVERSGDGRSFEWIGSVTGSKSGSYTFYDERPLAGAGYYRLRILNAGEPDAFSRTALVIRNVAPGAISVAPVPALSSIRVSCTDQALYGQNAAIWSVDGRELRRFTLSDVQEIDISGWAAGIYMLRLPDGEAMRIQKQ